MGDRWHITDGSRLMENGIASHHPDICIQIHGSGLNMEESIITITSSQMDQWPTTLGLANFTSTPRGSGSEIHNRSNLCNLLTKTNRKERADELLLFLCFKSYKIQIPIYGKKDTIM